ncbi:hypothetical protein DNTS_003652 [Danionella cerebrum]|uniref:Uncharacterized protein n=1 Tax=Danionella cerebrum TaxID=2873325 RepID=A0A553RCH8_9TELE|nr:hypothetical protein DNTS_003652 [Danionella translucida]
MDQQHNLLSSSPNSHAAYCNPGDAMASSLSGMTINDHHHANENGIAVGMVRPGDCPMKAGGTVPPALAAELSTDASDQHSDQSCVDHQRIQQQDVEILRASLAEQVPHSYHGHTMVSPDRTRSLSFENEPPAAFLIRSSALEDLSCVDEQIEEARAPYSEVLREEEEEEEEEHPSENLPAWASRPQTTHTESTRASPETELHRFRRNPPLTDAAISGKTDSDEDVGHEETKDAHSANTVGSPKATQGSPRKSLVPVSQFKAA